jgi:hypothetical protein
LVPQKVLTPSCSASTPSPPSLSESLVNKGSPENTENTENQESTNPGSTENQGNPENKGNPGNTRSTGSPEDNTRDNALEMINQRSPKNLSKRSSSTKMTSPAFDLEHLNIWHYIVFFIIIKQVNDV